MCVCVFDLLGNMETTAVGWYWCLLSKRKADARRLHSQKSTTANTCTFVFVFWSLAGGILYPMSLLNLYHWKSSSVLVQSTISEEPLNPAYAGFTAVVFALQH